MKIQPKVRGFICTTAHPVGCREMVKRQIDIAKGAPAVDGPKKVLVLGASMGYGLASRISAAFSCRAATLGVIFDKPASGGRTASAGWYNTAAFEELATAEGLYAKTINGDAFSKEIKDAVIALIKEDLGQVDFVVYSLAAPRRTLPDGSVYSSVLKTTGEAYTNKTIDLKTGAVTDITIPSASEEEIAATVKVMGGEDWQDWMQALSNARVLAENAVTIAYSYIGPELTHPMYSQGSIGRAKEHLFATAKALCGRFPGLRAYLSVNKALVTQSSSAIPIVPLYIAILYRVMKEKGLHEGCIEQTERLFREKLFSQEPVLDELGRLRIDDWEMREEVQQAVLDIWRTIDTENAAKVADVLGYWQDFYNLFGFSVLGVDYECEVDPEQNIPSLL